MKYLEMIILILVGVVNFYPVVGVFGANQLKKMYDMDLTDSNVILLLRHRAVLFGMLGAFIIYSALTPMLMTFAYITGFASMAAFIFLALPFKDCASQIKKIVFIAAAASILLLLAWALL